MIPSRTSDCQAGDRAEHAQALVRQLPRLRRFALRRFGEARADDVVQDALLRALEHGDAFDRSRELWPWLRRIAENVSSQSLERAGRTGVESLEADALADLAVTLDRSGRRVDSDRAHLLLERLRAHERQAIDGHYLRGLTVAEVAAEQNVAIGTVKARLSRARRRLAIIAASLATGALVIAWSSWRAAPSVAPVRARLIRSTFVVERQTTPEPTFRRVDWRETPAPTWSVDGGLIVTTASTEPR